MNLPKFSVSVPAAPGEQFGEGFLHYNIVETQIARARLSLHPADQPEDQVLVRPGKDSEKSIQGRLVAVSHRGGRPSVAPLTVTIAGLVNSPGSGWHLLTAAAFVSMALLLTVFFGLQRYFVRGLLAGTVKA